MPLFYAIFTGILMPTVYRRFVGIELPTASGKSGKYSGKGNPHQYDDGLH